MGEVPVREIDVHHVMKVLAPIWKTKNATATRVRGRMERILGWASINSYRSAENPARRQAYLSELLPKPSKVNKVTHHPAIPHTEIADFVKRLRQQPDGVSVRALEFLLLTAARTGEVIAAGFSEFDLEKKIWTVPADRMKANRTHVVPLSDRAVEIVRSIKHLPDEKFVFRGVKMGQHISNMAMLQLMRRMEMKAVPHGMRSSFRDWAADMTDFPRELAEAALAHVVGDKTEAAYLRTNRLDRRREMMDAWALYCTLPKVSA
jgi:integrase